MGACCGKSSTSDGDHFATPGRTLGDAPPSQPASSSVPRIANASPGRTLGASSSAAGDDPKTAAARAAEERLKASQGKGKLGKQLDAQKSKTQSATLAQASNENRLAREADAAQETRNYN